VLVHKNQMPVLYNDDGNAHDKEQHYVVDPMSVHRDATNLEIDLDLASNLWDLDLDLDFYPMFEFGFGFVV